MTFIRPQKVRPFKRSRPLSSPLLPELIVQGEISIFWFEMPAASPEIH